MAESILVERLNELMPVIIEVKDEENMGCVLKCGMQLQFVLRNLSTDLGV
jgi:hypothetical protein